MSRRSRLFSDKAVTWITALVLTIASVSGASHAEDIRKGYVDTAFGQVHIRVSGPSSDAANRTPLVLFHPNPYSGAYYETVLPFLGADRQAIAIDTPGYGGSDRPAQPLLMSEIAVRVGDALDAMGFSEGSPVAVGGYHTGAYIASELAIVRPDLVSSVVLIGVPYWDNEKRAENRIRLLVDKPIPEDGSHLSEKWEFSVLNRNPLVPVSRAHELFTESLRPGRTVWWAYHAVVNYEPDVRLPLVQQPVLVLNTHGSLQNETRAIVPLLAKPTLIEVPELARGIFEEGPELLANHINGYLSALEDEEGTRK